MLAVPDRASVASVGSAPTLSGGASRPCEKSATPSAVLPARCYLEPQTRISLKFSTYTTARANCQQAERSNPSRKGRQKPGAARPASIRPRLSQASFDFSGHSGVKSHGFCTHCDRGQKNPRIAQRPQGTIRVKAPPLLSAYNAPEARRIRRLEGLFTDSTCSRMSRTDSCTRQDNLEASRKVPIPLKWKID